MASITERGPYQWQAIIRRKGFSTQTKTFETKQEAVDWAFERERSMRRGTFDDTKVLEEMTLKQLINRYREEVTPKKRGWRPEFSRLKTLMNHPMASLSLADLRASHVAAYRDDRLQAVGNKAVREELVLLQSILNNARKEWSIPVNNCVEDVTKPPVGEARTRRLQEGEEDQLLASAAMSKNKGLVAAIVLAEEAGMRRGEIAELRWSQVDPKLPVLHLKMTKNGTSRSVPLTERAERVLHELPHSNEDKVFGFHDSDGMGKAFARACRRAKIIGLRFHDLRHEAASRMAQHMGPIPLAKVMGWKTLQMAMRYVQPSVEELVQAVRDGEKRSGSGIVPASDLNSGERQSSGPVRVDAPFKHPEAALNPPLPVHQVLNDSGEHCGDLPASFRNVGCPSRVRLWRTANARQVDAGRIALEHLPQVLSQSGASIVPLSLPMAARDSRMPPERQAARFRIKGSLGAR